MANKKFTDLTNKTNAGATDVIAIVDPADNTSKRTTVGGLITALLSVIPGGSILNAMLEDDAVTAEKLSLETYSAVMSTGTPTTAGLTAATVTLPTTAEARKYLVFAAFSFNHSAGASVRDYFGRIKLAGVTQQSGQWSAPAGAYVNTIPVYAVVTSTGGALTFVAERSTDNGGTLLATSHYTVVEIG